MRTKNELGKQVLRKLINANISVDTKPWTTKKCILTKDFDNAINKVLSIVLDKPINRKEIYGSFTKDQGCYVFTTEINSKNDLAIYFNHLGKIANFEIEAVMCEMKGLI